MTDILALIDAELSILQSARALIAGATTTTVKRGPGRPPRGSTTATTPKKKRRMSKEGRERLIAAVKARWAKAKAAKK
jgi:hypothetical protein